MTGDRVILHCDCDHFYVSVELLSHPELAGQPVAVAGDPQLRHGIILAKNPAAKRFGVQTAEPVWQALRKCPGLVLLPPHHEKYTAMSRRLNALYLSVTDQVEPFSVDESWLDVTGSRLLFGDGKAIADRLRAQVRKELGITISVGVSDNKTWAKMGSDRAKPDGTACITRENAAETLWPLPVEDMLFVGKAAAAVLRRHRLNTVGDLARADERLLSRLLGRSGVQLGQAARGEDASPVRSWEDREPVKSVGASTTYARDLTGRSACHRGLLALSDEVGVRLRAHRLKARTVAVQIKSPDLHTISRQRTLPAATALTRTIYREACALLDEAWPEDRPVRLLGVSVSSLSEEGAPDSVQLSMLEPVAADDPRLRKMDAALDSLRGRWGRDVVRPAALQPQPEHTEDEST